MKIDCDGEQSGWEQGAEVEGRDGGRTHGVQRDLVPKSATKRRENEAATVLNAELHGAPRALTLKQRRGGDLNEHYKTKTGFHIQLV